MRMRVPTFEPFKRCMCFRRKFPISSLLSCLQRQRRKSVRIACPSFIMRTCIIPLSLFALVATAATAMQFATPIQLTASCITTSTRKPLAARMPSTPTGIAMYTPPAETIDSFLCATKNFSDYLSPPMPTGQLLDVYYNHSDKIYEECEEELPKPFTTFPACPSVAKDRWCAMSTAVPSSALSEFRAYTSVASSWWAAHSSALADIKDECPNTWEETKLDIPGGEIWLNATIALADCKGGEGVVDKDEDGDDAETEKEEEEEERVTDTATATGSEATVAATATGGGGATLGRIGVGGVVVGSGVVLMLVL